jgi:multidrug resistance efflux pump
VEPQQRRAYCAGTHELARYAYTDGRAITISPQVSGVVVSLDMTDNQFVRRGQALIHIDPRQYQIEPWALQNVRI